MTLRVPLNHPDRSTVLDHFISSSREVVSDVSADVAQIIATIRKEGDKALLQYTKAFDHFPADDMTALSVSSGQLKQAYEQLDTDLRQSLDLAADRISAFHEQQRPSTLEWTDQAGVHLGLRHTPVDAAGLYVPGGKAAYPSSVLMNALPARVAGVERLVMVTPMPHGVANDLVLAAAWRAGIDEVWAIGGAQAVAALAFGTQSIRPVDKITGPGNAWVATAKRQVFGQVGIDSIAGPSEVLIMADAQNNADWIAMDLMAQAEHDELAQSILITDDEDFADAVSDAVDHILKTLPRKEIAVASWRDHGAIITVADWTEGVAIANQLAPEHLEIALPNAEAISYQIKHAGAIFIGAYTPEAIGDYVAGPNHVLPTSRTARFSSGLGVLDFMKRTTTVSCHSDALREIGLAAVHLAKAEGLDAHALSVSRRLNV
ncbi:MAG: histidinol dehydrogenase [Candidatus Puniceispirillales bacterium]